MTPESIGIAGLAALGAVGWLVALRLILRDKLVMDGALEYSRGLLAQNDSNVRYGEQLGAIAYEAIRMLEEFGHEEAAAGLKERWRDRTAVFTEMHPG